MTRDEATTTLAQVCAEDKDFLTGWDRSGTAALVAEALATLTGKKLTVAKESEIKYKIVEEEPTEDTKDHTFALFDISVAGEPVWRAFAVPAGLSTDDYMAVKEEFVNTITLMFMAPDREAAKAYVRSKYPNAKFWRE